MRAGRREGRPGVVAAQAGMHGEGPTQGLGARARRAERTLNMPFMRVTLEVLKLSGWLNAVAACGAGGGRVWGGGGASGVHGKA